MILARPLALLALFVPTVAAQQFQNAPGVIPGPNRWSEGVEAVDVDLDGDLDLVFADGNGFSSPGTKQPNVLLINDFIPSGAPTFTDASLEQPPARKRSPASSMRRARRAG